MLDENNYETVNESRQDTAGNTVPYMGEAYEESSTFSANLTDVSVTIHVAIQAFLLIFRG